MTGILFRPLKRGTWTVWWPSNVHNADFEPFTVPSSLVYVRPVPAHLFPPKRIYASGKCLLCQVVCGISRAHISHTCMHHTSAIHACAYISHTCMHIHQPYMHAHTSAIHARAYISHTCMRIFHSFMRANTSAIHACIIHACTYIFVRNHCNIGLSMHAKKVLKPKL